MQKLYQTEWHGIKFSDFSTLSTNKIADAAFYKKFYDAFYKKYASYTDISEKWRKDKGQIAELLSKVLTSLNYKRVLSIGCGIGYIESLIAQRHLDIAFTVCEPNKENTRWLNEKNVEIIDGVFPNCLNDFNIDFGFMSSVDYCFDDKAYVKLLSEIKNYNFKKFYLFDVFTPSNKFRSTLSKIILLAKHRNKIQYWGNLRTLSEHEHLIKSSGMAIKNIGQMGRQRYWLELEL